MEELDFSEEACIERFVNFAYFDEAAEDYPHIDGIADDDRIIRGLHTYGRIAVDWGVYETKKPSKAEEVMPQFMMAA